MNLQDLYQYAEQHEIQVISNRHDTRKAFCVNYKGVEVVSLDNSLIRDTIEEKVYLAEEIGHLESNALYFAAELNNPCRELNIRFSERKAQDWAVSHLVPIDKLRKALRELTEPYELAERFDVDEETVDHAIKYYLRKGKLSLDDISGGLQR